MDFLGRDQKVAGKAVLEDVEKLKKLYYNPKEPASFGGVKRLSDASGLKNSYILKPLVDSYNNSVHRSHGFAPANVTEADEPQLYKLLYKIDSPIRFRFAVNDVVRISKARKVFRKGYLPGWTEETFIIYKRYPTNPPTYVLQDLSGKEIAGRFYTEELQKIDKSDNDLWAIEKIIRKKGRGTSRQLFVKWVGFDDSFNSWIKAEWLKT
ncbi:chromo domain-containing protein [Trichonephila clavipes]|nr:chromo domain-containing protein [Trichonephila clavipes]